MEYHEYLDTWRRLDWWKLSALMEYHEVSVDGSCQHSWSTMRSWSAMRYPVGGTISTCSYGSTVDESLSVTDTQVASTVEVLFLTRPAVNRVPCFALFLLRSCIGKAQDTSLFCL